MASKLLERELGSITFAANQTRTLQLPRNYAYRGLCLKLVCNLTRTTTAGTDISDPCDCAPAQLVQNLQVIANGRDVIKNIDFETLHRANQIRRGVRPYISSLLWAAGADSAARDLVIYAYISFEMWRAIHPVDTLFDSAGLATFDLIVTFGTGMDTMLPAWQARAGAQVTVNSATLYVSALEEVGIPAGTSFLVSKEYKLRRQVTATSNNFQIDIPVGNAFRSFILKTISDGAPVNTILNNIKIKSGTEVYKNRIASFMQMDNRLFNQLEVPSVLAAQGTAQDHYLVENLLEGYYLIEFCPDGFLTQALDTTRLSSLEFELDVTVRGTVDYIEVIPCELIRPPQVAVAK